MSEISRRGFIGSAAAAAGLVGLNAVADEEFSFKNNVPNFGKPQSLFERFPRERVFIAPTEMPRHGDRELD